MRLGAIVAGVSAVALARAASWNLKDTYSGEDYMNKFDYWTDKDPTNGLVTYQSEDAAKSLNLTYVDDNKNFVMRVDTETTRTEGRPSVRIQSQSNYENAVIVYVDLALTQLASVAHSYGLRRVARVLDSHSQYVAVAYGWRDRYHGKRERPVPCKLGGRARPGRLLH